ncbi:pyrimidine utilization protein A [Acidisphaera sp. L21]|uniref:pyrimidine utilization protein A n=1 Tax=Acidisphaera sp. L21 TaxID=1641851 RepID=UPI00131B29FA|nr:pyrimidine utilization protein A [Acidisphaera sp. L21]
MEVGVFIPIGNNGWLISSTSPQYKPSFDLNRQVVQTAERHGLDFVLSMIKLRGFGGPTEFWDHNLDSLTLMAGLAAVTSRIRLFATVPTLAVPPAIAARMAVTIDSISQGRFGLNVITGWQRPEYSQMGIWPGDHYFGRRYDYASEYVRVMRELWETGVSDFRGEFFQMEDCRLSPRPSVPMKLICAGQSAAGMAFTAEWADYNFCLGIGFNTPTACAPTIARMQEAAAKTGRAISCFVLLMVITGETDAEAHAKWEHYRGGADLEAVSWMMDQAAADTRPNADTNVRQLTEADRAFNFNMGALVGSYATVAGMLDEMDAIPGLGGVMLTFDEFISGTDIFGTCIQPLMQSRRHIQPFAEAAE